MWGGGAALLLFELESGIYIMLSQRSGVRGEGSGLDTIDFCVLGLTSFSFAVCFLDNFQTPNDHGYFPIPAVILSR